MSDVLKIIAICTVALITALFLKQNKSELALAVILSGAVIVAVMILGNLQNVKQDVDDILNEAKIDSGVLKTTFKALGICFVTSFASGYCKDFGHGLLAVKIELAGRVSVIALTLPIVKTIVQMALELIG